jgi:hypothetical protein
MPISKAERLARRLGHSKQERLQVKRGEPSTNEVREGVTVLRATREGVVEYVKYNGVLHKKILGRA